jgi:hypothetical protein
MPTRAVIHVDLEDEARLNEALANVRNLLDEIGDDAVESVVVANGAVVKLLKRGRSESLDGRVEKLHRRGVAFRVCGNALNFHEVGEDELQSVWEVVPAGIAEIVRLEQDGFAYVKP